MERLVVCSFTWAVEMGVYGIIGFMVSSVPVLVWCDHFILIFSNTDMLINFFLFLFLLPHPASKGNASATRVTWRIQCTSIFAFGMNGEPTKGKWGDGELASSRMSPLPHADVTWSNCVERDRAKGWFYSEQQTDECVTVRFHVYTIPVVSTSSSSPFTSSEVKPLTRSPKPPAGIWESSCPSLPFHTAISHEDSTDRT